MPRDPNCVFCKIVSGELPAAIVYENQSILAFLDVNPLAEGHLLVIPREHYGQVTEMPPAQSAELLSPVPMLGRALVEITGAGGFNILINQGQVAGQVVPHVHCHLIPRKADDGLGYRWNAGEYAKDRAMQLAATFQQALPQPG
jgi:histidine triad (HIT) family protein